MEFVNRLYFNNLWGDFLGGLIVVIVVLFLVLVFGIFLGVGVIRGFYGVIFVGFFAVFCGGIFL